MGGTTLAAYMKKLGDWYWASYQSHRSVGLKGTNPFGRGALYAAAKRAVSAEDDAEAAV